MQEIVLSPLPVMPVDSGYAVGLCHDGSCHPDDKPYYFVFYRTGGLSLIEDAVNHAGHVLFYNAPHIRYNIKEVCEMTRMRALRWWQEHIPILNKGVSESLDAGLLLPAPAPVSVFLRFFLILQNHGVDISCRYLKCDGNHQHDVSSNVDYEDVGATLMDMRRAACIYWATGRYRL